VVAEREQAGREVEAHSGVKLAVRDPAREGVPQQGPESRGGRGVVAGLGERDGGGVARGERPSSLLRSLLWRRRRLSRLLLLLLLSWRRRGREQQQGHRIVDHLVRDRKREEGRTREVVLLLSVSRVVGG
jgi:hypothetical protein